MTEITLAMIEKAIEEETDFDHKVLLCVYRACLVGDGLSIKATATVLDVPVEEIEAAYERLAEKGLIETG